MTVINRTPPFLGKGIKFPFQINPATGGVAMSEANLDTVPVGMAVMPDKLTITPTYDRQNHIAESMAHILTTIQGQRDMLPRFGSRSNDIIHDPNNQYSRMVHETWVELAVARWEKRVILKVPDNLTWVDTDETMEAGEAIFQLNPTIIPTQVPGNLVAPFVGPRDARNQEYPLGEIDSEGHDWTSRYHGLPAYEENGERWVMPVDRPPLLPQADDGFYTVVRGDNWWSIADEVYQNILFAWCIWEMWIDDQAEAGASADALDITNEIEPGTMLRYPSLARVLTQMAA